jgi:hypothetical protein
MKANVQNLQANFSIALVFFLLVPATTLAGKILTAMAGLILYNIFLLFEQRKSLVISGKLIFLFSCFCGLAIFSILFVVFYPGGMITDSHFLFSMAYTDKFHSSYRSRFLALIYQLFLMIHKSTLPILVAQLFLYASGIWLLIRHLLKDGLLVTSLLILCMAFMPMFSGLIGVLCENTWIATCYLFGMILLYTSVRGNQVRNSLLALVWLFLSLAFFTRPYDVLYGLPLFYVLFIILIKQISRRNAKLPAIVLMCLMLFGQVGVLKFIDMVKEGKTGQNEKFINYYRALPVPFDTGIKLPKETREAIEKHLKSKSAGWKAMNDLGDHSILVEGKKITREEVVPEIVEYIRKKPYTFLKSYLLQAAYLLVIPYKSNWVTSTNFLSDYKLNKLSYKETTTILEKRYVQLTDFHRQYAYIYQPVAILLLSLTALLLAISNFSRFSIVSLLLVGWAGSGCIQVLFNLLLAYHGAYRMYHWSVLSSILSIVLIHARQGRKLTEVPGSVA